MRNRIKLTNNQPALVGQATATNFKAAPTTVKAQFKSAMRKRRQSPFLNN